MGVLVYLILFLKAQTFDFLNASPRPKFRKPPPLEVQPLKMTVEMPRAITL